MSNINAAGSVQSSLNRCNPAAADAKLGDVLAELIAQVNRNTASIVGIAAKLDADAGVTDTNYTALWVTAPGQNVTLKDLESRY
jgi:hypothetical protein